MFTVIDAIAELWWALADSHHTSISRTEKLSSGSRWASPWLARTRLTEADVMPLVLGDGENAEDETAAEIELAAYGDTFGSDWSRANYKTLTDNFVGITTDGGPIGCDARAYVVLGECPSEFVDDTSGYVGWLVQLVDRIDGLEDHPVMDDEDLDAVQQEAQQEAWDSWLRSDVMGELGILSDRRGFDDLEPIDGWTSPKRAGKYADDPRDLDDIVHELFNEWMAEENNEWLYETGGNATPGGRNIPTGAEWIGARLFGWDA